MAWPRPAGSRRRRRAPRRVRSRGAPSRLHPGVRGGLRVLLVRHGPAPDLVARAALADPGLVDRGDDGSVTREQRLGGAHLGARRQLALGDAVAPVLAELLDRVVLFRAARAEGALVHLAAQAEGTGL